MVPYKRFQAYSATGPILSGGAGRRINAGQINGGRVAEASGLALGDEHARECMERQAVGFQGGKSYVGF